MKACCSRRTGRARPCINSYNTDYREHRMRSVYVRASMAAVVETAAEEEEHETQEACNP